jgi:hypothetical protein
VKNTADMQHHLVPDQSAGVDAKLDLARWYRGVSHTNCAVSRFGFGLAIVIKNNEIFDDGCDARTRVGERHGRQGGPIEHLPPG